MYTADQNIGWFGFSNNGWDKAHYWLAVCIPTRVAVLQDICRRRPQCYNGNVPIHVWLLVIMNEHISETDELGSVYSQYWLRVLHYMKMKHNRRNCFFRKNTNGGYFNASCLKASNVTRKKCWLSTKSYCVEVLQYIWEENNESALFIIVSLQYILSLLDWSFCLWLAQYIFYYVEIIFSIP